MTTLTSRYANRIRGSIACWHLVFQTLPDGGTSRRFEQLQVGPDAQGHL